MKHDQLTFRAIFIKNFSIEIEIEHEENFIHPLFHNNTIEVEIWKKNLSSGLTIINKYFIVCPNNSKLEMSTLIASQGAVFSCSNNVIDFEKNELLEVVTDILIRYIDKELNDGGKRDK